MAQFTDNAVEIARLSWLTGPIFEKELLVASRRIRYYLLRTGYVLFLCGILGIFWLATAIANDNTSNVIAATQMSAIARTAASGIMWFQFITLQMLAVVMLSNSISDEVRKRTLDVLATTPITSLQFVLGKLLSRLLQLLLLLAVSFPFLAIIRAFGGIPWSFLAGGLAVTLTATIFVGSVTLCFSMASRQAWKAIVAATVAVINIYILPGLLEQLIRWLFGMNPAAQRIFSTIGFLHPFTAMFRLSRSFEWAGAASFNWPGHCLAVLGISLLFVVIVSIGVRRAMLAAIGGAAGAPGLLFRRLSFRSLMAARNQRRPVVAVTGDPIIWKDMPRTASRWSITIEGWVFVVIIFLIYCMAWYMDFLFTRGFHTTITCILVLIGLLRTATCSASSISSEKEARAWPILLCTPLEGPAIFWSKVQVILRRTMHIWIILLLDLLMAMFAGVLDVLNVVAVIAVVLPAVVFLIGIGVFFGLKTKTQTTAFVATFGIPLGVWFACPCATNPVTTSAMLVSMPLSLSDMTLESSLMGMLFYLVFMGIAAAIHLVVGIVLGTVALRSIRKNPF